MAPKIDPTSIHLGGDSPEFSAEYVPVLPEDQPPNCALPPASPLSVPKKPLLPLLATCSVSFPDVIPLPPVYNPPNLKFLACEHLSANVDIQTTSAAKKSYFTLSSNGPKTGDSGLGDCSITLGGLLAIDACESFTSSSVVTFNGAASGSLVLTPSNAPACGVALQGNILVKACEDFSATNSIAFGDGMSPSSYIRVIPSSAPNCGFTLTGLIAPIVKEACEKFEASIAVTSHGKSIKKNAWSIKPSSTPDCAVDIVGDLDIDACASFTATSNLNIHGKAVKSGRQAINVKNTPDCGFSFDGDWEIDACPSVSVSNSIKSKGLVIRTNSLQLKSTTDKCGIELAGELDIFACSGINLTGGWNMHGGIVKKNTLRIETRANADGAMCGLNFTGEAQFEACAELGVTTVVTNGTITIKLGGKEYKAAIVPILEALPMPTRPDDAGKCALELKLKMPEINLDLGNEIITGVDSSRLLNIGLVVNNGILGLARGGGNGFPGSLSCSLHSTMELETLRVDTIQPSACCVPGDCPAFIDLCKNFINIKQLNVEEITANPCRFMEHKSRFDLAGGTIDLKSHSLTEVYTHISDKEFWSHNYSAQSHLSSCSLIITTHSNDSSFEVDVCNQKLEFYGGGNAANYFKYSGYTGDLALTTVQGTVTVAPQSITLVGTGEQSAGLNFDSVYIDNCGATAGLSPQGLYMVNGESVNAGLTPAGLYLSSGDTANAGLSADSLYMNDGNGSVGLGVNGLGINPGGGASTMLEAGQLTMTGTGPGTVTIAAPGKDAYFQQVTLCVAGVNKTAWVLMTEPE